MKPCKVNWFAIRSSLAVFFSVVTLLIFSQSPERASATTPAKNKQSQTDRVSAAEAPPHKFVGVQAGDCKKCHPSEVATWMKTVHFQSADIRLEKFEANTKKYAEALGIKQTDLMKDSLCSNCHGSKSVVNGQLQVISGVSCESCHGGSGGKNGWLNRHQSYHQSMPVPRTQETSAHRKQRIADCEKAGMVRAPDIYNIAKSCFGCHIVNNEKLVAAGHKAASAFEFVSWSSGEIRHNFQVDKNHNAAAPSLWLATSNGTADQRRRMKFVVGALAQLEVALRRRAEAKNPVVVPQLAGLAAAANGKLAQINGMSPNAETLAVAATFTPLLATLFVPQPNDESVYAEIADNIAEQTKLFVQNHNGSQLQALDPIINILPAHFSQQYQKKYLKK